jgi:nucleotide-binding universal stress UspA family protein
LGLVFVTSIGALFFWMFRVPPALPLPVVKVHRSLQAIHKILVPIVEAIPSERAVELACRLGHDQKADLVLVHVIVVPHTLDLNAAMPDRERIAHEAIELGCMIAERVGCRAHTRILRHRNAADGILRVAREEQVDAIVLGVTDHPRVPGEWGKTSIEILHRAPCEVVVDRVPVAAQPLTLAA